MDSYTPERWTLLSDLLNDALLKPEADRAAFLDEACAGDETLRDQVERLLKAHRDAEDSGRFSRGALDIVPLAFPQEKTPEMLGPYRLIEEVGRGGMGNVWLAERADGLFEQKVAIKMMRAGFLPDESLRRFDSERRILARLNHPNIARVFDGGVAEDGRPYLVMEYVEGVTITEYCNRGELSVEERLRLFLTVCDAVAFAHQNLIVHRDLKPANILVTDGGIVKLLDFGIAKLIVEDESDDLVLTRTGMSIMTPEYAAPEQVTQGHITTATDVYSLGIVLFELVTGVRPYSIETRSPSAIERAVCHSVPARPSTAIDAGRVKIGSDQNVERLARRLRGDLDTIILKALRKEPERRYPSAAQFAEDLTRHMQGLPVTARPDTTGYRLRKFISRNRLAVASGAVVSIALVAGLIVSLTQTRIANSQRERADVVNAFLQEMLASPDPYVDGPEVRVAEVLERAGALLPTRFSGRPDLEAALQKALGTSYLELGMFDEAETHLTRSLVLVTDRDARADAQAALADLKKRLGDLNAADSLFSLALQADLRRYGRTHPRTAKRLASLGALRWEQGDYDAAEPLMRDALVIMEANAGPDSLDVAALYGQLGVLLSDQGKMEEAENYTRRALELLRRAHGNDHPEVALALSHIGIIRDDLEDSETARTLHSEALEIYRRVRGASHPDVGYAMNNLAAVEIQLGNLALAESLQVAAIEIYNSNLGEYHQNIGILYNNLGSVRRRQGDVDGAMDAYRYAITIWRESLSSDHPYLAYGLHNAGALLYVNGSTLDALPMLKEAYDIRVNLLAADNTERANTASMYGAVLGSMGDLVTADSLLTVSYEVLQATFGDSHSATINAKERLDSFRQAHETL